MRHRCCIQNWSFCIVKGLDTSVLIYFFIYGAHPLPLWFGMVRYVGAKVAFAYCKSCNCSLQLGLDYCGVEDLGILLILFSRTL